MTDDDPREPTNSHDSDEQPGISSPDEDDHESVKSEEQPPDEEVRQSADGDDEAGLSAEGSSEALIDGDPDFRKLHLLTAASNVLQWGFNAGALGFFAGIGGGALGLIPSSVAILLAFFGFLLGAGYGVAYYLVFEYRLGASALHITSGVLRRQNREIPLQRIQNVDIHQTFIGRLLGLAAVRLETAGGGQTEAELRLVTRDEANRLQREVRRRKRRERNDDDSGRPARESESTPSAGERAFEEPETVLFELSIRDLLVLSGVSFRWGVLFILLFGIPLVSDALVSVAIELLGNDEMTPTDPLMIALGIASVIGLLLASWVISAALTFVRYFDFRLSRIDDELVYERGLLQRYSGSIPLDKIQTLTIRENPLMRQLGYAALLVETAGYTPGQSGNGGQVPSAVPLADQKAVEAFATDLEGVESFDVSRPPSRARNRYVIRYSMIVVALTAVLFAVDRLFVELPWYLALAGLLLTPVAGHLKWTNRGFNIGENHLVTRSGFWRRSTQLVPYYRIQNVVTERTYFQRRWRIASVIADTASSAVLLSRHPTAHDIDENVASELHRTLRDRLRASLVERRGRRREERSGVRPLESPTATEEPNDIPVGDETNGTANAADEDEPDQPDEDSTASNDDSAAPDNG